MPLDDDPQEFDSILDEAKSMAQIGKYHNHIVNLQGIVFEVCNVNKQPTMVGPLILYL